MVKLYLGIFFLTFLVVLLSTPFFRYLAKKFKVLDYPRPRSRKVHSEPIPRWGGLSIYFGLLVSVVVLYFLSVDFRTLLEYKDSLYSAGRLIRYLELSKQLTGVFIAASLILILGMIDDKRNIPPIVKLLTQIIAAYIAMDYGVRILGLSLPQTFGGKFYYLPTILSQIITVVWLVGFMNTINLVDGLDGLATGIVAIAAFTFFAISLIQAETKIVFIAKQLNLAAILSIGLCGATLGFLAHNFYPAKIFLGDTGSMLLGFLLGTIAVIGTLKTTAVIAFFIPILVIGLPVADVFFAIIRRFCKGKPIFEADKEHFHHRLLRLGWTQKEIVFLVYIVTLILSQGAILLTIFRGQK
ncbi:MAG TPA: undecaprenyl-phosphate alpha-N-acetylglucosaminyl 1-phosphate transferase [Elusimicrobia bacterium]|jgi:UDP-GlcNAc:undecaprenyl-phosphate GlcNAc-1-phosphate transferase|nr:undecaprenyl-phosphate alpha-N-acetylglucosaminyl 1-phosphate transferase [Elusimicrobiota bacterium]